MVVPAGDLPGGDPPVAVPIVAVPDHPDRNPAAVYLAGKPSATGRRGLQRSLDRAAEMLTGGLATSSRYGPGLQLSMIEYCSSGLRECSRLRDANRFTWRRPGASVLARFLAHSE